MTDKIMNIAIKVAGILVGFSMSFFEPIWKFLAIVMILVFIDLITGIHAAKKRKEKINSKGLRKSIQKVAWYFLAILTTRAVEWVFFEDTWIHSHVTLTYVVSGFISSVEFQSNIENIGELTGIDIWARIKEKVNDLFKSKSP